MLYTEMITAEAIIHGKRDRLLGFSAQEHPLALQLGGADPHKLAIAAVIGADYGYDEINLNVGCPSGRVQSGRFGACLMAEPQLVGESVDAMRAALPWDVPVSVKCRIGIDEQDSEEDLEHFVSTVAGAGCETFIVHARKAWLHGLSPKQNRDVPPLDYARVHRLKARHPHLTIIINGGLGSPRDAAHHLERVDGVMLGRAAYQSPYLLAGVDQMFFASAATPQSRAEILQQLIPYAELHLQRGGRLNNITRHILGLYAGRPRARAFRRLLSERACGDGAGIDVLHDAIAIAEGTAMPDRVMA